MASSYNRLSSAATINLTAVKPQGGGLKGYSILNTNAAIRYVKYYDSEVPPTVGTTVPVLTIQVPATGMAQLAMQDAMRMQKGIWLATTVNAGDSDNTAVGAGDLLITTLFE